MHWKKFCSINIALAYLTIAATSSHAKSIVSNTRISQEPNKDNIFITFNEPIRVLNYSPTGGGNQLTITVIPSTASTQLVAGEKHDIATNDAQSQGIYTSLDEVHRSGNQANLLLTLPADKSFRVRKSSNDRVLLVTLSDQPGRSTTTTRPSNPSSNPGISVATSGIMENARQALAAQDYDRAITLYQRVLNQPPSSSTPLALEFLGVAREKSGRSEEAKSTYEQFISSYPNSPDINRVEQRLAGLETQAQTPQKPRLSSRPKSNQPFEYFAFLSTSYSYATRSITPEGGESIDTDLDSSLSTDIDVGASFDTKNWLFETRLSGGVITDLLEPAEDQGIPYERATSDYSSDDETRLSAAYVDILDKQRSISARVGRQHSSKGGVLGLFDGSIIGLPFRDSYQLNLVGGFPADNLFDQTVQTDNYFFGANIDYKPKNSRFNANAFVIQQILDSITDRRAVGGEVNYAANNYYLFSAIDYDFLFGSLNALSLGGSVKGFFRSTFHASYDYRVAPTLSVRNATIGQGSGSIPSLLNDGVSEEDLQRVALDRQGESSFLNLSVSTQITEQLQLINNLNIYNYSGTEATVARDPILAVDALEDLENQITYDTQLVGLNYLGKNDVNTLGFKFFTSDVSEGFAFRVKSRYPITRHLRVKPSFIIERVDETTLSPSNSWTYIPAVGLDFNFLKRHHLEFEVGGEISSRASELAAIENEDQSIFFGFFNYQLRL